MRRHFWDFRPGVRGKKEGVEHLRLIGGRGTFKV